jgi:hypothetical protein
MGGCWLPYITSLTWLKYVFKCHVFSRYFVFCIFGTQTRPDVFCILYFEKANGKSILTKYCILTQPSICILYFVSWASCILPNPAKYEIWIQSKIIFQMSKTSCAGHAQFAIRFIINFTITKSSLDYMTSYYFSLYIGLGNSSLLGNAYMFLQLFVKHKRITY